MFGRGTILFLASVACLVAGQSETIRTCPGYEDYPVQLIYADFPYTIPVPGEITFDLYTLITEDLPDEIILDLEIEQQEPFPAVVPCLDDGQGTVFGSCNYELCPLFEGDLGDTLCSGFPEGNECGCPLLAGDYNFTDVTLSVPDFGETFGSLLEGTFEAEGLLVEKDNESNELGCFTFIFEFVLSGGKKLLSVDVKKDY